jgi:hypothetical protein
MKADAFIKALQKVRDYDLKDALDTAHGRVRPLQDPIKFINQHKKDLNMEKVLKKAIHNYFMTCTQKSYERYPNDPVKQVTMELKLKQEAIPKLIKGLQSFYPEYSKSFSDTRVCRMGCSTFGCYREYKDATVCGQNFCYKC